VATDEAPAPASAPSYPLVGFLVCPIPGCGAPMHGETMRQRHTGKRVGEKIYVMRRYRCGARMISPDAGSDCAATVASGRIEEAVAAQLAPLVTAAGLLAGDPGLRADVRRLLEADLARREAAERRSRGADADAAAVARLEARRELLDTRFKELRWLMVDKKLPFEEYQELVAEVNAERQQIAADLAALGTPASPAGRSGPASKTTRDTVDGALASMTRLIATAPATADDLAAHPERLRIAVEELVAPRGIRPVRLGGQSRSSAYGAETDLTDAGEQLAAFAALPALAQRLAKRSA
jgi:hypothetical protein